MALKRAEGGIQPGIKWWRFTMRIPGIHVDISWADVIQGGLLTLATAGAATPLFMRAFGLPFELAFALSVIPIFWYYVQSWLFGEPFAPGWITPSIPLVLVYLERAGFGIPAIQAMTALILVLSAMLLFFAVTGLGQVFFKWIPIELRAGIVLGAAIAAINGELTRHATMPITLSVVWAILFVLMFSAWIQKFKETSKILRSIASMGMLIGFLVAGVVGPLTGEIKMALQWGIFIPEFGAAFRAVSPFYLGWPSWEMFVSAVPMAVLVYIIVFGDLVLGATLAGDAGRKRPDETIDVDITRMHYTLFFRNIGQLLTGGPLIPMHGPVWTGVTVYLYEKYKEGRDQLDSIHSGIVNWYWLAFILVFSELAVSFMRPILPVALSITMILTGFACAYIAMRMVTTPTSQGYALLVGLVLVRFGPAWGLLVGFVLFALLLVQRRQMIAIPYDNVNLNERSGKSS